MELAAREGPTSETDVAIIGAGVLGASIAYWVSSVCDCRTVLIDKEEVPGVHASSRNTGVIHRPFYLDPEKKRIFALTAGLSYPLWQKLARTYGLPWKPVGTINVALTDAEVRTLERYKTWGAENGVQEEELTILDRNEVLAREPEVRCRAALLSRTDVSADFGIFTRALQALAVRQGVQFIGGATVEGIGATEDGVWLSVNSHGDRSTVHARFIINAAGGGALSLAHRLGLGRRYSSLSFRGEYWVVDEPFASRVNTNVYRPPRHPQFPFLDPHIVVRADGARHIGPNAVLVTGPYVYGGVGILTSPNLLSRPAVPKLRLLADSEFVALLAREWRSSLSKRTMCGRVKEFVPSLDPAMLRRRAVFGVRSSVVDSNGFVPEAVLLTDEHSAHIINYNSPGATGAPAFSAMIVKRLQEAGLLRGPRPREGPPGRLWSFVEASDILT
jgi:(S)-2-hydroxyglutarate dehydrogenase